MMNAPRTSWLLLQQQQDGVQESWGTSQPSVAASSWTLGSFRKKPFPLGGQLLKTSSWDKLDGDAVGALPGEQQTWVALPCLAWASWTECALDVPRAWRACLMVTNVHLWREDRGEDHVIHEMISARDAPALASCHLRAFRVGGSEVNSRDELRSCSSFECHAR